MTLSNDRAVIMIVFTFRIGQGGYDVHRPFTSPIRLTHRDLLWVALIVLFAFALRAVVVFNRAAHDPAFHILPPGSDQVAYMSRVEALEAGEWPREPFFFQPGFVYYLAGIRLLVGNAFGMMRLATSVIGAVTVGLMIGVGWFVTGRRWGGYLAGLLLAVYPVAIFYSTVLLIPGLASFYVALFLFVALWQRHATALWRSLLLGVILGLLAITRSNLVLLWGAWLILLAGYATSKRTFAVHAAASFVGLAATIAPVTIWNITHGANQLITSVGVEEIYRGNSRDSNGIYVSHIPAYDLVEDDAHLEAFFDDIVRDPLRFVELQVRKTGIYWSAIEPANNISYRGSGETSSALLRAIPLDFRILSALGLLGTLVLVYNDRRTGLFFTAVHVLIYAGIMVIWVEGRLRQPAVIPLVVTVAYLVVYVQDVVSRRQWEFAARRYAFPVAILLIAFVALDWAVDNLPRQRPIAALPADVRRVDVVFNDELRFVGWRPLADWPVAEEGWGTIGRNYVIEWFWEVLRPVDVDYNAFVAYINDDTRLAGWDTVLGEIGYPPHPTSQWQPGEIYSEIVGFKLNARIPPGEDSGEIWLDVYRTEGEFDYDDDTRTIIDVPITSLENPPAHLVLQSFAVFAQRPDISADISPPPDAIVFGDLIAQQPVALPQSVPVAADVTLQFQWMALANITENYQLFVHVVDADEHIVAQFDGPPRHGEFVTSTWPPGLPIDDSIALTMPSTPGTYRVYTGWYHPQTYARLPVAAPDNRVLLSEITVR